MKILIQFFSLCLAIPLIILCSCERLQRRTLTTTEVTGITINSAISGGNITFDGGAMVSERGVCWGINRNPTISDDKTSDGAGEGSYSSTLNNLTEGTIYYVRAYATSTAGAGYGNEVNMIVISPFFQKQFDIQMLKMAETDAPHQNKEDMKG